MDDNDYDGRASITYTDQTTHSSRIIQAPMSDAKKELVRAAAPGGGRCLVENCAEEGGAIEFAYCIPRSFSWRERQMMDNLEWWWNLPKVPLNLDTRYNIFPLGLRLHTLLNKVEWLLIPEATVVDHYHAKCCEGFNGWETERAEFSPNPAPVCRYNLVPMPYKMRETWISRQDVVPAADSPLQLSYISSHLHPFTTLPPLESNLRPHFAIFEAGRKLAKLDIAASIRALADFPRLNKIVEIYAAWIKARPSTADRDESFVPTLPRNKLDIDDEAEAQPRQCKPPKGSPRRQPSSPTPHGGETQNLGNQQGGGENIADNGRKRKRARHRAPGLSGETLRD
ncbi:hypothetical protein FIBSPDRAFT_933985 [Athelia psychrophila]|uniref:HNH nuclease domain-containing protein n=1 Tax=Athelia psychrophila TaxID=1759441 RepID=A0A166G4J3_9AGAM|nr:hypothetical protein FIBSPDRAFT_933985 [Fibularhizoctonia sp. CBS 109695]